MNKQELIERVKECGSWLVEDGENGRYVKISKVRELIDQLDEPQKVKIPKFVAEYLEECKGYPLRRAMFNFSRMSGKTAEWLYSFSNQELFARAWLDGYEVEEELYILPVPYIKEAWYYRKFESEFVLTMIGEYAYKFTESELDEYFPEIKKFAKRVEE